MANVEDAVASPIDIPSSIARYQKTLQYASSPLDMVFGIGLYLSPSDMELQPGNVKGYNNEVVIAGSDAVIGHNPGINESEPIGPGAGTTGGKIDPPAGTVHRGPDASVPPAVPLPLLLRNSGRQEQDVSSTKTAPSGAAELQSNGQRQRIKAHDE